MKMIDVDHALEIVAKYCGTTSSMTRYIAEDFADRLAADQQKGGGEAAAGLVSGYLPASRCVEIKLDGPIPDWVKELPKRAYLTSTAELEAVGRSGEGHNADWCAGWNAHNLIMSAPQPSIPAPASVPVERLDRLETSWRFDDGYLTGNPKIDGPTIHRGDAKKECANELAALVQEYRDDS